MYYDGLACKRNKIYKITVPWHLGIKLGYGNKKPTENIHRENSGAWTSYNFTCR
jgi:hypothetical protein